MSRKRSIQSLLEDWAVNVTYLLHSKKVDTSKIEVQGNAGLRIGTLFIRAGIEGDKVYKILTQQNNILLRDTIPWDFADGISVAVDSRYIRVDCSYPRDSGLAIDTVDISNSLVMRGIATLNRPRNKAKFITGVKEDGSLLMCELGDRTTHFLIAGATGSGKSVTLQWIAYQFLVRPDNDVILLDGKGNSFHALDGMSNLVGPVANEPEDIRNALLWAEKELTERQRSVKERGLDKWDGKRLIVFFDEFQELVDESIAYAIRRITSLGRSSKVHIFLSTQRPSQELFRNLAGGKKTSVNNENISGEAIRGNLTGRIALKVAQPEESRMVLGGSSDISATKLLGFGDAWVVTGETYHRVQMAYISPDFITQEKRKNETHYLVEDWDNASTGHQKIVSPNEKVRFDGETIAEGVRAVIHNIGRPTLMNNINSGATRAIALKNISSEIVDNLSLEDAEKLLNEVKSRKVIDNS